MSSRQLRDWVFLIATSPNDYWKIYLIRHWQNPGRDAVNRIIKYRPTCDRTADCKQPRTNVNVTIINIVWVYFDRYFQKQYKKNIDNNTTNNCGRVCKNLPWLRIWFLSPWRKDWRPLQKLLTLQQIYTLLSQQEERSPSPSKLESKMDSQNPQVCRRDGTVNSKIAVFRVRSHSQQSLAVIELFVVYLQTYLDYCWYGKAELY